MRLLVSLPDETQASALGDYLLTIGIDNSVEEGSNGWQVWVKDDDKLDPARRELADFQADPADPRYTSAARDAQRLRSQDEKRAKRLEKNYVDVRTQWAKRAGQFKAVTLAVIALSCLVYLITMIGGERTNIERLLIRSVLPVYPMPVLKHIGPLRIHYWGLADLTEIRQGQLWRLITPIFFHTGLVHLLFNMFMLRDFGFIIEGRKGHLWLAIFILLLAIPSNLAQYMMEGPLFGGMSGVVYGLFGYLWMKTKYAPHEGMQLHPYTIFFAIGWFIICFTPLIGNIANTAHAIGLLIGVVVALAPIWKRKLLR
jgi:GlpG protein